MAPKGKATRPKCLQDLMHRGCGNPDYLFQTTDKPHRNGASELQDSDRRDISHSPRWGITSPTQQEHPFVEQCVQTPLGLSPSASSNRYRYPFSSCTLISFPSLLLQDSLEERVEERTDVWIQPTRRGMLRAPCLDLWRYWLFSWEPGLFRN